MQLFFAIFYSFSLLIPLSLSDLFLHRSALGTLVNLSRNFKDISLTSCRCLLNLLGAAKRKLERWNEQKEKKQKKGEEKKGEEKKEEKKGEEKKGGGEKEEREIYAAATTLDYLFQTLNSCLSRSIPENPHLIYSIVVQKDLFGSFPPLPSSHLPLSPSTIENVQLIVNYFSAHLHSCDDRESPSSVFQKIDLASRSWSASVLLEVDEYDYIYDEREEPDDYFISSVCHALILLDRRGRTQSFAGSLETAGSSVVAL